MPPIKDAEQRGFERGFAAGMKVAGLAECERLRRALKPFADAVSNDNGDMTVSPVGAIDPYVAAYFALNDKGAP